MKWVKPARLIFRKASPMHGRERTIVTGVVLDGLCPDGNDRLMLGAAILIPVLQLRSNGATHGKSLEDLQDYLSNEDIGKIWMP